MIIAKFEYNKGNREQEMGNSNSPMANLKTTPS